MSTSKPQDHFFKKRNHLASTPGNIIGRASLTDRVQNLDKTGAMKDRNFPLVRFTYKRADALSESLSSWASSKPNFQGQRPFCHKLFLIHTPSPGASVFELSEQDLLRLRCHREVFRRPCSSTGASSLERLPPESESLGTTMAKPIISRKTTAIAQTISPLTLFAKLTGRPYCSQ